MRLICTCTAVILLLIAVATPASAAVIVQATSATTTSNALEGDSSTALDELINQSGLTNTYTSGVTDFDAFTAATNHNSTAGRFRSRAGVTLPGVITFDLGSTLMIDRLSLWNAALGGEEIKDFNLFADGDSDFSNGGLTSLGSFTANQTGADVAQIFNFSSISSTRFVHMEIVSGYDDPLARVGAGEVAFSSVVPEPVSAGLLLVGAGCLSVRRRHAS